MKYTVEIVGRSVSVEIDGDRVLLDGRAVEARLEGRGPVRRLVRGRASREFVTGLLEAGQWRLLAGGHRFEAAVLDPKAVTVRALARSGGAGPQAGTLKAPMPGMVVRVLVAEGEAVEAGRGLVVLEAMKMENELRASGAGTVRKVFVAPGARVEKGASLVEIG